MRTPVLILSALSALVLAAPANAQQQDVQITSEAVSRTCREIHHNASAQGEAAGIGPGGNLVINCRLIGPGGMTLAQVAPAEVCQRLTGSSEWYRGMGTQVYCRSDGTRPTEAKAPRSFTANQDDVARACQKIHRDPDALADPITRGPYGLVLNCRLTNQNGVTLARVSPEEVCDVKFGTRGYMEVANSPTFVCTGTGDGFPNKPPTMAEDKPSEKRAVNDVPLTPEAVTNGCRAIHGSLASGAPFTYVRDASRTVGGHAAIAHCNVNGAVTDHSLADFCPHVSGTQEWYLTDFGRGTWLPGETPGAAPRFHVCRGKGKLDYHAVAEIGLYCAARGYTSGNFGVAAAKTPACVNANMVSVVPVDMADVCREIHRASAHEVRGWAMFCLPDGGGIFGRR